MVAQKRLNRLFFLFVFLTALPAGANDTAFGGQGAVPMPIQTAEVEMVSEKVVMNGAVDEGGWRGAWRVDCEFVFKNHSPKPLRLTMGFPFPVVEEGMEYTFPKGKENRTAGAPLVHNFKTWIDGKPVQVRRTKISKNPALTDFYYNVGYLWEASFPANGTVMVRNTFTTGMTTNVLRQMFAEYVLKTGGLWKNGRIGHSHLEVRPNVPFMPCEKMAANKEMLEVVGSQPAGAKMEGQGAAAKMVWDLKSFSPKKDLSFCFVTQEGFNPVEEMLAQKLGVLYWDASQQARLRTLPAKELRILRNTVFARYGYSFKDPQLKKYFESQWWYVPHGDFSESKFSPDEKNLVETIARMEKGH